MNSKNGTFLDWLWRPSAPAGSVCLCLSLAACSSWQPTPAPVKPSAPPRSVGSAPTPVLPAPETRKATAPVETFVPVPGAEKADIRVGDRLWLRGGEGLSRPSTILREVTGLQNGQVQYRQLDADSSGNALSTSTAKIRRQSLSSLELDNAAKASGQVRYVDFPLGLGKTWSYRYQLKNKSGALTTYDIVARVEAEENLRTPAGSFKVLRILHGGQWSVPVVDKTGLKVSSGSLRSTLWFAPALGNWVKFESEILNANGGLEAKVYQELIQYERRSEK